jgi:hypothetical protein
MGDQLCSDESVKQAALLAVDLYAWYLANGSSALAGAAKLPPGVHRAALRKSERAAARELTKPKVKKAICDALKSAGSDAFDIAKVVAATLVSLSIAHVVVLPTTPLALAAAALLVLKSGIAAYCSDCQ